MLNEVGLQELAKESSQAPMSKQGQSNILAFLLLKNSIFQFAFQPAVK